MVLFLDVWTADQYRLHLTQYYNHFPHSHQDTLQVHLLRSPEIQRYYYNTFYTTATIRLHYNKLECSRNMYNTERDIFSLIRHTIVKIEVIGWSPVIFTDCTKCLFKPTLFP